MKSEEYIEVKAGRRVPFKVPEDYFENLAARVEKKLPPYPAMPNAAKLTLWQRYKPYFYMAAMFAGIWCMMKMFHMAATSSPSLDAPADNIAMVMADPSSYGVATETDPQADFTLESEVASMYNSPDELADALDKIINT